jgi:small-conductance mechanosensitive channel
MFSSELQKRTFYFVGFLALVTVFIFVFPQILTPLFGLQIDETGNLVGVSGKVSPFVNTYLALIITIFKIFKVLLFMSIVISVVRYINYLIFGAALKNSEEYEISSLLRTVLTIIIYIVSFFIIFQTQFPKIQLAPLFTGSAIIGIVVGLALQDTLGNLFSGIAIQADQSFQVGDIIKITNQGIGTVESVSWRGVKIRTFQNKLLVISNSVIGKETIEVAQKEMLNARIVRFNTLFTNSPAKVIQVVREAVRQVENVSPKRRPKVRIWNLGDNGIDWEIKYWTTNYRKHNDTDALIRQRVWYAFQREGLDFAYPTRTIYTAKQSEEGEVFVETANEICERINNVPIFAPLSNEETSKIAESCSVRVFAPEEPIIEKGQTDKSMFIVHRGIVNVEIKENGIPKVISTLRAGDFFGEMSLFTGEPRTADVVADSETQVLEIKPYILKPILDNNPEVARVIGEIIDDRRELLAEKNEDINSKTDADTRGVFKNIKKFFGLN